MPGDYAQQQKRRARGALHRRTAKRWADGTGRPSAQEARCQVPRVRQQTAEQGRVPGRSAVLKEGGGTGG